MDAVLISGKKNKPNQNGLKADLHIHTCDGFMEKSINYNAFQLIDAAMERDFEVLSITNHDDFTYSDYLKDYALERGILLIPGIELTLKHKHVLAYPLSGNIDDIDDLSDLEKESKQQISDLDSTLKRLYTSNPELESEISTYMEQIVEGFTELRFEEPTKIPDVFLKEFENLL